MCLLKNHRISFEETTFLIKIQLILPSSPNIQSESSNKKQQMYSKSTLSTHTAHTDTPQCICIHDRRIMHVSQAHAISQSRPKSIFHIQRKLFQSTQRLGRWCSLLVCWCAWQHDVICARALLPSPLSHSQMYSRHFSQLILCATQNKRNNTNNLFSWSKTAREQSRHNSNSNSINTTELASPKSASEPAASGSSGQIAKPSFYLY